MKKSLMIWVLGGLITVSAIGLSFDANKVSAADQPKQAQTMQGQDMMQGMKNMDPKSMAAMMNSPEMQKQCVDAMKDPQMQKAMINVMKQPEMQAAMKQMLQQDAGFHQMMLDLVNSVDMNMEHGDMTGTASDGGQGSGEHSHHH
jgi:hypothetical protein